MANDENKKNEDRQKNELTLAQYRSLFEMTEENTARKESKAAKALATALDIRKFEIDLYWKRATYFWAFIAATFTAYFLLLNSSMTDPNAKRRSLLMVSCLGIVFSVAWYFVNRASKKWQENWEKHVDLLEDAVHGPLYKTVITDPDTAFLDFAGPYDFSVSKLNQTLSLFIVIVFVLIAGTTVSQSTHWFLHDRSSRIMAYLTIAVICGFFRRGKTGDNAQKVHVKSRKTIIVLE